VKILIVNTFDIQGGAARAAYRLHKALLVEGVCSQMLVQTKLSDDYTVLGPVSKLQKGLAKIRQMLDGLPVNFYKNRSETLFSPAWVPSSKIVKRINSINPDVVHLHWVVGGMLAVKDIAKIKAPIVWSLHDNWAFTGGCHIMWECERYKEKCGTCPRLGSLKDNDLSQIVFKRKIENFSKINNLTIVGLSRWLADCASKSYLFKKNNVVNLPNPIDIDSFSPIKAFLARELLHLAQDKKIIVFGSLNVTSDINKGYRQLCFALSMLKRIDIELVIFGASQPKESQGFDFKTHYLGCLHDDLTLRMVYSAADVMVVPSLQENLSNTIMESLACATPVVGFDVGGNCDLIEHKNNGYLAKKADEHDLAKGIEWVLSAENYDQLCSNARDKVVATFDSRLVAKQYIELYQQVCL